MKAEVTYEDGTPTPAFPSRQHQRRLENLVREVDRHRRAKLKRGKELTIEDRALHERTKHILKG
jgi:hypothetical protein